MNLIDEVIKGSDDNQDYFFNDKTIQVAYKIDYMEPSDHGYMKGMKAYMDLENNKCICRHFDNPYLSIRKLGFRRIVKDGFIRDISYDIPITEVIKAITLAQRPEKLMKLEGKVYLKDKKKIVAKGVEIQKEKQENLMGQTVSLIDSIRNETNEDKIVDNLFFITDIIKKNHFTSEELKQFMKS